MIARLLSVLVIFTMLISGAGAATNSGLKAAFDELNYSLSVEWDQKDRGFYDAQMKKFTDSVSYLQTQGLSNAEIVAFVKSQMKNEALAKDVETAFNVISINKMNQAEATQYMIDTMKRSYARGAAWNYEVGAWLITGAIVVGFALLIIFAPSGSGTTTTNPNPGYCTQYYQCNPFCYNDAVYGYTCQQNCFWTCY